MSLRLVRRDVPASASAWVSAAAQCLFAPDPSRASAVAKVSGLTDARAKQRLTALSCVDNVYSFRLQGEDPEE